MTTQVKTGQLWKDLDPRSKSRRILVLGVKKGKAACCAWSGKSYRFTSIQLSRFVSRKNGYALVYPVLKGAKK